LMRLTIVVRLSRGVSRRATQTLRGQMGRIDNAANAKD
jgi:hypothetical protein